MLLMLTYGALHLMLTMPSYIWHTDINDDHENICCIANHAIHIQRIWDIANPDIVMLNK